MAHVQIEKADTRKGAARKTLIRVLLKLFFKWKGGGAIEFVQSESK